MAPNLNASSLPPIGKKYRDLIQKETFDAYEEILTQEGLQWFFEFRIPRLIPHLVPLMQVPGRGRPSPRLQLLLQAIENSADLQRLDSLYRVFLDRKDFEAAAGAAGLALNRIWDAGKDFDLASVWWERTIRLIEEASLTRLARAFLYVWKAALTTVWRGQVGASIKASEEGLAEARSAGSRPLELYHMAGIALSAYHATDISKMEFYLMEGQSLQFRLGALNFLVAHPPGSFRDRSTGGGRRKPGIFPRAVQRAGTRHVPDHGAVRDGEHQVEAGKSPGRKSLPCTGSQSLPPR
jgi:hypothetical protein